ncbi:uncharacterized protein BJ212DRAFT_1487325 [Suillus subaureus]|uniref:Uncharacterized protein n=1 Tax=Suillus subaureus TaxID=48587 RepID=A0A9P7DT39_9AGAM|nr:uncharacterized protein BJ212DRAFT_1487325 [Suillus subaureus]KAG1802525.1 hypothetical protein BJ212DRAFT_1487325 [Suillus subaureus]
MSSVLRRASSTVSSHNFEQSAGSHSHPRVEDASHSADTCNAVPPVIAGRKWLRSPARVSPTAGGLQLQLPQTIKEALRRTPMSLEASGCTTDTRAYEHNVVTQSKTVKVQLFDTASLDEGSQGTVPATQAERNLKNLLRSLGTKDARALWRNYKLLHSKVRGKALIVLVVTALEDREPEMEDW